VSDVAVTEGHSGTTTATLTLTLSAAATGTVTVNYATVDAAAVAGSDYQAASGQVTFAAGVTTAQVSLGVFGDTVLEPDEAFSVQLSNPVNAQISDGTGLVTIVNDEVTVSVTAPDAAAAEAGSDSGTFVVTRNLTAGDLAIQLAWSGSATLGTDYTVSVTGGDWEAATGTLTLHNGVASATLTIAPVDDTLVEASESILLTAVATPTYQLGAPASATVTLADNDAASIPSLSVSDASIIEGRAGRTSKATVTISLSAASAVPVTVQLRTVDGTATGGVDYMTVSGVTLTFAAGVMSQTYSFDIIGDGVVESDETFTVQLSNPTQATMADGLSVVTIVNDDKAKP
jgi:hypothetical protein